MLTFGESRHLNTRLDELHSRLEGVLAVLHRLETEWLDTRDQVRKSYQRLEAAAKRAKPDVAPTTPTNDVAPPVQERSDPYSKKLAQIRSQHGAIPSRTDESTG